MCGMQLDTNDKRGRLRWLDIASNCLITDGTKLKPHLAFDGTHMAPAFLQIVRCAITALG